MFSLCLYQCILLWHCTYIWRHNLHLCKPRKTANEMDTCIRRFRCSGIMSVCCWASASQRKVRLEAQNALVQAKRLNMQCDPTTRCLISEDPNTKKHCCGNHKSHIKPAVSQDGYRAVVTPNMWRQCYMRMFWYKPLHKQREITYSATIYWM